ncbi:MAG: hypothetical protein LEGION0398_MBIBDBAK_01118 [Legionellaceae bacterium]
MNPPSTTNTIHPYTQTSNDVSYEITPAEEQDNFLKEKDLFGNAAANESELTVTNPGETLNQQILSAEPNFAKKPTRNLLKYIANFSSFLFTMGASLPVTGHFVLGMSQTKDFDIPKELIIISAISCYLSSFCMHEKNNRKFFVKLANICTEKKLKLNCHYYSIITIPLSSIISLLTASASTGLGYAGVKKIIELCISDVSSPNLSIFISSSLIAALDFPQTLMNEGKDTYKGINKLASQDIPKLIKKVKELRLQHIQELLLTLKKMPKRIYDEYLGDADQLCTGMLKVFTIPFVYGYKNKAQIVSMISVRFIPILLALGGSFAYGTMFFYGVECLKEFVRDFDKFLPEDSLLHLAILQCKDNKELIEPILQYSVGLTSFINCYLFYGEYTIKNTIEYEKWILDSLSKTYYEIRHAHAAIYSKYQGCIGDFSVNPYDTDEYKGILSQKFSCPRWQKMLEATCDWGYWFLILFIRYDYVLASFALTYTGMNELTSIIFLKCLIGFCDLWQAYVVESIETHKKTQVFYTSAKEKVLNCLPIAGDSFAAVDEENPTSIIATTVTSENLLIIKSHHTLNDKVNEIKTKFIDFGKYPFFYKETLNERTVNTENESLLNNRSNQNYSSQ